MHRIHYISTARSILESRELEALLTSARRRNAQEDITGLLVAGGRRFLQVLEGPYDAVTATYERIVQDPRHFAVVQLSNKAIGERSFSQWAMGFERGSSECEHGTLEIQVETLLEPIQDPTLRAYFAGFARSHSTTVA